MALFTIDEARAAYKAHHPTDIEYKSAASNLFVEQLRSVTSTELAHDVFVSYSHRDAEVVLGICYILRNTFGLKVYVDRDDQDLSNNDIEVADQLKQRMASSRSLMYIASDNDSLSHWMPWELGYFDGLRGTVAVLPVTKSAATTQPHDRPYLRIYPYIDKDYGRLWVFNRKGNVETFQEWMRHGGKFQTTTGGR